MTTRCLLGVLFVVLAAPSLRTQAPPALPYDHIHLTASDPEKAYDWYLANLEGRAGENAGRLIFEPFAGGPPLPAQLMFIKAEGPPSEGGVIERLGFSFADVAAKVRALEAAGARIVAPVSEEPGLWKRAVVVDPWGVTIELVEDRERLGFHHIALRVADPEATTAWLLRAFGGERVRLRGRLEALRYGSTYIVVRQGAGAAPSRGRAIDHLGWGPSSMDATAADLRSKGVAFTAEPQPKPNQLGHRTAYVEAPGGIRIELVQHTECAWGRAARSR